MIKTDNLYAEVVINESPFYYDDHGRLRARVLNEEQSLNELSMRGPEAAPTVQKIGLAPMPKPKQDDEEAKLRAEFEKEDEGTMYNARAYENPADHPKERKYAQWKQDRKNKQGALTPMPEKQPGVPTKTDMPLPPIPVRGGPAKQKPGLGKIIGGIKRPGIGGIARPMPAKKPDNDDGMMRTADMQDRDLDGTDDRDQKPTGGLKKLPAKPGMESGLKKLPAPAKPGMDSGNKPRIGAMPRIIGLPKPGIGGVAMPEKKPDATIMPVRDKQAMPMPAVPPSGKVTTDQGFAPGEGRDVARPAVGVKRPGKPLRSFRFSSQSRAGAGRNVNTRAGLRNVRPASRNMMETSRPATDYIEEKMNLKTAEMGEVIKDFQKSDAPQFKGKSKAKRRMMAIAAKLQADRG